MDAYMHVKALCFLNIVRLLLYYLLPRISWKSFNERILIHWWLNQVLRNIELGLAALRGEKGPAYDRIVLNAGMVDHLLGCAGAEDISSALDRAREVIDSGNALKRLMNYIKLSHKVL